MFNWIDRIFRWGVVNIGGTIVGWVRDFIHGVWGFLNSLFGHVGSAWHDLYRAGHFAWDMLVVFCETVAHRLYHLIRIWIPEIVAFFKRQVRYLFKYADYIFRLLSRWVKWLIQKIEREISFVLRWVNTHIWVPLTHDLRTVWHWITHFGDRVWFLITHPGKLLDIIWDDIIARLEREAWKLGGKLGKFFLGLVLHNAKRFALLLEDIILALI